ncbi:hypothetical protein RMATCC62417_11719 [Rhizopus microsporus]|nr:hypothetical protein RMATCC62417_11719 [Rhizopus microsporus]
MSLPSTRLQGIKAHLSSDSSNEASYIDSLRLYRKPNQPPNLTTLDPLRFLLRSAMVFANRTAVIHHHRTYTYRELSTRVQSLATVLINTYQVKQGDRVAVICSNIPPNLEATYAIPAVGAIIVPVNTRLAAQEIEYIIQHSGAKVIILQRDFKDKITQSVANSVRIIDVVDSNETDPYEQLLMNCKSLVAWDKMPLLYDENATISINYTSGSTGRPKGVMVTYRGAYLAALGMIIQCALSVNTVYLWTLPMFHCNGWNFPWALVAAGATQIMLSTMDYDFIWKLLVNHGVTHYNGAPTVQNEVCNNKNAVRLSHPVKVLSGGSVLSSTLIKRMRHLNLHPTQVYGLTEVYGPVVLSYDIETIAHHTEEEQYKRQARQGYNITVSDETRVLNQKTGLDVMPNGKEVGEVCFTGNVVMKGYYNDPEETAKAFRGGVFWSGDLAVRHSDGTIELVDRSKDVIVSGGENISSIEVECVIVQLEEVSECAVVAAPSDRWGERPVAFVVLKDGSSLDAESVLRHCRNMLAGYKCPDSVVFVDSLPKTSTGKHEITERGVIHILTLI